MTTFEYIILGGLALVIFIAAIVFIFFIAKTYAMEQRIEEEKEYMIIHAKSSLFKQYSQKTITKAEYDYYLGFIDQYFL